MNSFGEYLRSRREQLGLPLRKVAAELDIDTSILSKIERSERVATIEMLPTLAKTLEVQEKEMEIEFIKAFILSDLGELKYLKSGLEETLNTIKSRK
jgi:transcriptional regulator with XRE-family HTH domain